MNWLLVRKILIGMVLCVAVSSAQAQGPLNTEDSFDVQSFSFASRLKHKNSDHVTFNQFQDWLNVVIAKKTLQKEEALEILAYEWNQLYPYLDENLPVEYRRTEWSLESAGWLPSHWNEVHLKVPNLFSQFKVFNYLHEIAGIKRSDGKNLLIDIYSKENPYQKLLVKVSKTKQQSKVNTIDVTNIENLSNQEILEILAQQRDIFQKGYKAENYPLLTLENPLIIAPWWNDAKSIELTWKRIQEDIPGLLDFNVIDELTYEIASLTPGNNLERMAVFCDLDYYSKNQYQIALDRTVTQDKKTTAKLKNYYGRDRLSMNHFIPMNDQPPEWWNEFRNEFPETWIGSRLFKKIETIEQAAKAGHYKVVELWKADPKTTLAEYQNAIDISIDLEQKNITDLLTNDSRVDEKMVLHMHERQELVRLEKSWKIEKEGGPKLSEYNMQRLFRFSARFGRDQNVLELTTKQDKESKKHTISIDSRLDANAILSGFRLGSIHHYEKIVQYCLDTKKISLRDLEEMIHEVGIIDGDEDVMKVLLGSDLIKNENVRKLTLNQAVDEMVNTELRQQIFRHAHREEYGNIIHHDGDYLLMDALYVLLQDPVIDPELKNQAIDLAIANIHPSDYTRIHQFQNIMVNVQDVGADEFKEIKENILKSEDLAPKFEYPKYNDFVEYSFNAESKIKALVLERDFYNTNNEAQKYGYTKIKSLTELFNQRIEYLKSRLAINASWEHDLNAFESVVKNYGINDRTFIEVVAIAFNTKNSELIQVLSTDKRWNPALQDMRLYAANVHNNVAIENLKWFDAKQEKLNKKNGTLKGWFVEFYKKHAPIFGEVVTLNHETSEIVKKNELSEFQWAIYDAIHSQINPETQLLGKAKTLAKKPLKELLQMPESAEVIQFLGSEFLEYAMLFSETIEDPKVLNIFHSIFENQNLPAEVKETPRFAAFAKDHPIIVANGITGKKLVRSLRNLSNTIENNKILKFRREFVKRAGLGDFAYIQKNKNNTKIDRTTINNAFTLAVDKNKSLVVRELKNHKYIGSNIKEVMFLLAASYDDKRKETFEELKNEVSEPILEKALNEHRYVQGDILNPTIRLEIESILNGKNTEESDRFMGDSEHQPIYMESEYTHDDVVVQTNGITKADFKKWSNTAINWFSNLLDHNPFGSDLSPVDVYLHDEIMSDIVRGRNDQNWNSKIPELLKTLDLSVKKVMKTSSVEFLERAMELNNISSFKTLLSLAALDIKSDNTLITKATLNALMTDPDFPDYDNRAQYLELLLTKTDLYLDQSGSTQKAPLALAYLLGDKEVFGLLLKHSKNVQMSDLQKYESMLQPELTTEIRKISTESGFVNNDQFLRLIEVFNHNKTLKGHRQVAADFYTYLRGDQNKNKTSDITSDENLLIKKVSPPVEMPVPDLVTTVASVETMIPVAPVVEKTPSAVDDVIDLLNQAVKLEHYGPMDVINYVEEIKHDDAKRIVWNNLLDAMGVRTDITDLTDPAAKKFFEYALYVHKHGSLGSRDKLEGVIALRQIGLDLFNDRIQDQDAYKWDFQAACDALIFGQHTNDFATVPSIYKSENYKSLIASTDLEEVKRLIDLVSSNDLAEAYLNLSFEQDVLPSENKKFIIDYLQTETYAALKNGKITDRYLVEALIGGDVDLQTISTSREKAEAKNNKVAKNTLQRKANFIFIEAVKSLDLAKIIAVLPDVTSVTIAQALELLNKHPDLKNSNEKSEIEKNLKLISDAQSGKLEDVVKSVIKNKIDPKIKDLAINIALDGAVLPSPKQYDYVHIVNILAEYVSNEQVEIALKREHLPVDLKKSLQMKLDNRNQNASDVVAKNSFLPISDAQIKTATVNTYKAVSSWFKNLVQPTMQTQVQTASGQTIPVDVKNTQTQETKPILPSNLIERFKTISKMNAEELAKLSKAARMQIFKGLVTAQLTLDQSHEAIQYLAKASQIENQAKEFPKEFGKFFSVLLVLELKKVASRDDVKIDDFLNLLSQGPFEALKLATFSATSAGVVTGWGMAEQLVQTKLETQYRPIIIAEAKNVPVWGQALARETSFAGMGKMQVAMLAATLVNQMIYGPKVSAKELIANSMRSQAEFFLAQITVQQIALRGLYAGIKYSKTLSSAAEVAYTGAKTGSKLLRVTPVGWASFLAQMIIVDRLEEKYQKDTTLTQANNNMYESEYDLEAYLRGAVPSNVCDGYADKGSCFANRAIQGLRNYDASALDYQFKEQQAVLRKKQDGLDSIYNHAGLWNSQDQEVSQVSTGIKLEEYKQDQRSAVTDYIKSINPRLAEMQNTISVSKRNAFYTLYTSSEKLNQVMDEHCSGLDDENALQKLSENEIVIRVQKCDAEIKNYQMTIQDAVQILSASTRETQRKYNMGVSSWISDPMSRGDYVDQALYMIGRVRNLYATGHEELRDQTTNEMFHRLMETVIHPVVSKMNEASEGMYYASFHAPLSYGPGYYKSIEKTYGMYDEEGYKAHLAQQMEALKHPEQTYKTDDFHDHTISLVVSNPADAEKKYNEIVSEMTKLFQCDQKSDVFTAYLQKYMGIQPESQLSSHLPNQDIGYVQVFQPVKIERLGTGLNRYLKTYTITRPQFYAQDVACSVH